MDASAELPDYRDDPHAYEVEEQSRPDEMAMIDGVAAAATAVLDRLPAEAAVLDLCCGTGLSLMGVVGHPHARIALGVDNCRSYLDHARNRYSGRSNVSLLEGDAIDAVLPETCFDLVILCSAYHHIEDDRKPSLLQRVYDVLSPNGRVVVGENLLPPYQPGVPDSYSAAVRLFYEQVLVTALEHDPHLPAGVHGLIQRVAQYGYDGDYEYKTSVDIFLRHLPGQSARDRARS
jgi:ubiquinone/menaquinone biosynthesis C-methylase UbiE